MSTSFPWTLRWPAKCVTCGGAMPKGDICMRDPSLGKGRQFWHTSCTAPADAAPPSTHTPASAPAQDPDGTPFAQMFPDRPKLPRPGATPVSPDADAGQSPDQGGGQPTDQAGDASDTCQDCGGEGEAHADQCPQNADQQDQDKGQQQQQPGPPDDPFTALIKRIAGQLDAELGSKLHAEMTREIEKVARRIAANSKPPRPEPVPLLLTGTKGVPVMIDGEHFRLPVLVRYIADQEHVWLVGPKGTGKSHAARVARDALNKANGTDLPFYSMSVGPQSIQSDFFGYMFPNGTVYRTKFREWFEHGGVFCLDEIDAGSADVLTSLNSALANGWAMFPDGMIQIHPTAVLVATANTDGSGRTELYAGRTQQDGALIDRFAFVDWPIDEALEERLVSNKHWLRYIRDARTAVATVNQAEISMRAAIKGAKDLAAGQPLDIVIRARVAKGLSPEALDVLRKVTPPKALTK